MPASLQASGVLVNEGNNEQIQLPYLILVQFFIFFFTSIHFTLHYNILFLINFVTTGTRTLDSSPPFTHMNYILLTTWYFVFKVGVPVLLDWSGHFVMLGYYTFLSTFIDPAIR